MIKVVLEAPVNVLIFSFVLKKGVHESEVVSFLIDELGMCVVGLCLLLFGPEEDIRSVETSHYGEDLVDTVVFG